MLFSFGNLYRIHISQLSSYGIPLLTIGQTTLLLDMADAIAV